ncbi:MAG: carbon-nitrogen hydrolase family protein [Saprospiraceae bacterium]|nr:carbon-nitrogen hydrolase family protein [Saprospiraceae bacterium]
MRIALAQIAPAKGDIEANIRLHLEYARKAAAMNANAVFFSELSLTAYEPHLAKALKLEITDPKLQVLQQLSDQHQLTIGVGAPTPHGQEVQISMLLFQTGKKVQCYTKQMLHADEKPFFTEGDRSVLLSQNGQRIAPAICYESMQPTHLAQALALGADLYLASVAKHQKGVEQAATYFAAKAAKHRLPILMVNCVGECDNFLSAGQTAVWNRKGECLAKMDATSEGLLIYDTLTESVQIEQ